MVVEDANSGMFVRLYILLWDTNGKKTKYRPIQFMWYWEHRTNVIIVIDFYKRVTLFKMCLKLVEIKSNTW